MKISAFLKRFIKWAFDISRPKIRAYPKLLPCIDECYVTTYLKVSCSLSLGLAKLSTQKKGHKRIYTPLGKVIS